VFDFRDIAAYVVGISGILWVDTRLQH
jgi:hypothetical protein